MFPCADSGFPDIEFFHQGIGEEFLQLFLRLPCVGEALQPVATPVCDAEVG